MKIDNTLLAEYYELNEEIKEKTRRLDEIKVALKENGACITEEYICVIEIQNRTALPGLQEVLQKINRETLENLELIRSTAVKLVKVTKI